MTRLPRPPNARRRLRVASLAIGPELGSKLQPSTERPSQLADAIGGEATEKVRGRASSVDGLVVECPFDEFHTNSGDTTDKASFVMNAGITDTRGFVWKCHHASCQGRDRLDFLAKAIADGWFDARVLDMPEYQRTSADPCLEATKASAALTRESSTEETGNVFRLTVECDERLVRAAILEDMKSRTGMGLCDAREVLKDYEKKARAESPAGIGQAALHLAHAGIR